MYSLNQNQWYFTDFSAVFITVSISEIYVLSFSNNTLILISETSLLIEIAEKQWIFTNDHSYKYNIANQWIWYTDSDLENTLDGPLRFNRKDDSARKKRNGWMDFFTFETFDLERNFNWQFLLLKLTKKMLKTCWKAELFIEDYLSITFPSFRAFSNCIRKYTECGSSMIYELSIFEMSSRW